MADRNAYWKERSENYDEMTERVYKKTNEKTFLLMEKYIEKTDRVLDFACGTGVFSMGLCEKADSILSIDTCPEMLAKAKKNIEDRNIKNVTLKEADLFDGCLKKGSFDVIVAANVLCYLENWDKEMCQISELLKDDGIFLSATDCLGQRISKMGFKKFMQIRKGKLPFEAFYTGKKLKKKIEASGFKIIETERVHLSPANYFIAAKKNI